MQHHEHRLQTAVAVYLNLALPDDAVYSSIDHAGARSRIAQAILTNRGVKKGWPDLDLAWRGIPFKIELKHGNNQLTPDQEATFARLERAGVRCFVCRSVEDVEVVLRQIGVPLRATTLTAQERDARLAAKAAAPKRASKPRREKPDARTVRRVERLRSPGSGVLF